MNPTLGFFIICIVVAAVGAAIIMYSVVPPIEIAIGWPVLSLFLILFAGALLRK